MSDRSDLPMLGSAPSSVADHKGVRARVGVSTADQALTVPRHSEVFWCADPQARRLLSVSPAVEQLFGLSVATLLNDAMQWNHALVPADAHLLPRPFFDDTTLNAETELREYRILGADLHTHWIRDRRFMGTDPTDGSPRLYGIAQETSALKAWQAAQPLQPVGWYSLMSHELRTPLHAIQGWSHVLRQLEPRGPLKQKALDTIERNVQVQSLAIEEFLDSQQLLAGQLTLSMDMVSLAPMIDGAIETMRAQAHSRGIRIQVQHHPGIGLVRADRARLRLVLTRLLSEAIKAGSPGSQVCICSEFEPRLIRVRISHDCSNPLPSQLPLQFASEATAPTATPRPAESGGIGLHLARQLIELHGGRLAFRGGEPNYPRMFLIELPDARQSFVQPSMPAATTL